MEESQSKTLVTLVTEAAAIEQALIESGGEIGPELEALIPKIEGDLALKVDSYAYLIDRMKMNCEFYKQKAKDLTDLAKKCEAFSERLQDNMTFSMLSLGKDELNGNEFRYKLQKSESAKILDEKAIPAEFQVIKVTETPDRVAIKNAIKEGREVPGAALEVKVKAQRYKVGRK